MAQPMKNVRDPRPIKSRLDLRVEPLLELPDVVELEGFGVGVTVAGELVADGLALELVTTRPPMVLTDLQEDDGGAGWGGGVAGSPWWKVEPP